MIDRRIFLVFVAIFAVSMLSASVDAACSWLADDGRTNDYLFANFYVCPYNPVETLGKPLCPEQLSADNWYPNHVTPLQYENMQIRGEMDFQRTATDWGADKESNLIVVWENIQGCYSGEEGQYYVWFQVHSSTGGKNTGITDGYCYEPIYIVNWDLEPDKFCKDECVGSQVDYEDGVFECCGDDDFVTHPSTTDELDCLKLNGNYLCAQVVGEWKWMKDDAFENIGNIVKTSCGFNLSVVSDGSKFLGCTYPGVPSGGTMPFVFENIAKGDFLHMYACFDTPNGEKEIAECAPNEVFSTGGLILGSGDSIELDNTTYYCTMNRERADKATEFVTDLDSLDPINAEDCANAGFAWTGTKCCSEAGDESEHYNDREGYNENYVNSGGCWDKQLIRVGEQAPGRTNFDILNYLGGFEGCKIPGADPVLSLTDDFTDEQLVNNNDYCAILEDAAGYGVNLFCSYGGQWEQTDANGTGLQMKTTEWDDSSGCCDASQCWDGSNCIDDQSEDSEPVTYSGYRCIGGKWNDTMNIKYTWDNSEFGFCPSDTQCLVNPSQYAPVNCIGINEYSGKTYCDNGEWTSRTKLVALALFKYGHRKSPTDYTLFCDSYENILNYYNYRVGGELVLNYMGETNCQGKPCVNEFCVLRYPEIPQDIIVFGTSINEPIDSPRSFLKALNEPTSLCDTAMDLDNQYHRCGNSNIWYNHMQGTVIFMPTSDDLTDVPWTETFDTFVRNPFETIREWVVPRESGFEFFNQTGMFTKIYADVSGGKKVFAFLEEGKTVYIGTYPQSDVDYLGLEYHGLDLVPCNLIRHYDPSLSCSADQTIFAQSRASGQQNLVDAWPDLTSKLRIR